MNEIPVAGPPIRNGFYIESRTQVAKSIAGDIDAGYPIVLAGKQRTGKTSLIYEISSMLDAPLSLYDAQDFYFCKTPEELLEKILEDAQSELNHSEKHKDYKDQMSSIEKYLKSIDSKRVFAIDEFAHIISMGYDFQEFTESISGMSNALWLVVLHNDDYNFLMNKNNDIFNNYRIHQILPLTEEDVQKSLRVFSGSDINEKVATELYKATKGNPYILNSVLNQLKQRQKTTITKADIIDVKVLSSDLVRRFSL